MPTAGGRSARASSWPTKAAAAARSSHSDHCLPRTRCAKPSPGARSAAILISDPAFAGSDTLATARALAAALRREGPFDLILTGRNSVDADTGQVGPCLAELLELPFLGGVKRLEIDGGTVSATCEQDDRLVETRTALAGGAVVRRAPVRAVQGRARGTPGRGAADRIQRVTADELGPGPWGQAGSPTVVGELRVYDDSRRGVRLRRPGWAAGPRSGRDAGRGRSTGRGGAP